MKTAWLGQGSAYFLGAGILVSQGSNNVFEADYDAQGQGLHMGVGLLMSQGNNNLFRGGWGSIGVSGDRSVGFFISEGNNNTFEGTEQSIGTSRKPKSLGVFLSFGNNNTFTFKGLSSARLHMPHTPKDWSQALFLSVGDYNSFPKKEDEFQRGTNRIWGIKGHSLGLSLPSGLLEKPSVMNLFHKEPKVPYSFNPLKGWEGNTACQPLSGQNALTNSFPKLSYDKRRQIYESLDLVRFKNRKLDYNLAFLFDNPAQHKEDVLNYGILWALRNQGKFNPLPLKEALESKKLSSEYSKKMAVNLLGTFWSESYKPLFIDIMLNDPSEELRYFAALYLTRHLSGSEVESLKKGANSDSEVVRFAIAKGLQESTSPDALNVVLPLLTDQSFYVRRAAGLTVISYKDKKGIPIVLETLKYRTLDLDENYGNNLYKQLNKYLGVDFGLDSEAWIHWWESSKDTFTF